MVATVIRSAAELHAQNERIAEIVAQQRGRLLAFVRRRLGDALEAEEIVQEVFFELTAAHRLAHPIEHLAGWLMRVARNRVIDRFRRRKTGHQTAGESSAFDGSDAGLDGPAGVLETLRLPEGDGPESAYHRDVLADAISEALAELPSDQRDAFIDHELEGFSIREIAANQGVSVNTLLGRKHAAVLHLRARLRTLYHEQHD